MQSSYLRKFQALLFILLYFVPFTNTNLYGNLYHYVYHFLFNVFQCVKLHYILEKPLASLFLCLNSRHRGEGSAVFSISVGLI